MSTHVNILSTTSWVLKDLSELRTTLENCQEQAKTPAMPKSYFASEKSVIKEIKKIALKKDTSDLSLMDRFLRFGCWASMPIFFLKVLILSLTSVSLVLLTIFPAEALSALVVVPYLLTLLEPTLLIKDQYGFLLDNFGQANKLLVNGPT